MDQHSSNQEHPESSREESMRFVVSHYRKGAFSPDRDWHELRLGGSRLRRHAAAAAIWGGVLLASAAVATFLLVPSAPKEEKPTPEKERVEAPAPAGKDISRRIEFADASLEEVADSISKVYGVSLSDMPAPGEYRLTLSYEGTAEELVEVINDILGTSIRVSAHSDSAERNPETR